MMNKDRDLLGMITSQSGVGASTTLFPIAVPSRLRTFRPSDLTRIFVEKLSTSSFFIIFLFLGHLQILLKLLIWLHNLILIRRR